MFFLQPIDEIDDRIDHGSGRIEKDHMAHIGNDHQVRARNLAMQALGVFYRRHLVLSTPQNQHGLAHDLQVRRNRIDITGNEQADVLVEDLLAQFAVPLIDVLVDDVAETVDILDRVGERRAQVTNHIFVACLFGCVEVLALLYIGQRPVFSERVQIANSIDEYDRSHPIAIQPGGENLRHTAAEADAHENDVSEIEVPQQVVEHVGLAPDGCVGGPGMIGLPESKHIDGVDRSLQTAQLRNNTLPGEGARWNIVQQNNGPVGPIFRALNDITDSIVNRTRRAPLQSAGYI